METTKLEDFKSIILKLASPEDILSWSYGEVTKPETINYRTQRAEKDGLFCEKIFGPEKDWECYCGKYRRIRYKGVICDKCGVEVTRSSVRRERMGHIKLASPVSHIWFLRGVPSKMGTLLDISVANLEKVIYFSGYIITKINEENRKRALAEIEKEYKSKIKLLKSNKEKEALKESRDKIKWELNNLKPLMVLSEIAYRDLSLKFADVFEAGTGAEALRKIMMSLDLNKMRREIISDLSKNVISNRKKLSQKLKLIEMMIKAGIRPEWMFLTVIPVIPPELRPMVQLDGGRYATSDLNDLYRRVINRNNRLKRLFELNAPEVICRNEKRMLQEAVDALIDNSTRKSGQVVTSTAQKRPLKSLADILKGKQGRFRQNLLGKRVDYSGRSVIVVGPELKLHQCGLPKKMALELFRPFVIHKLIEREIVYNPKGANRLIEKAPPEVWAILEEVIQNKYVLLNRAPTLHRLGIQAFQPVLIEGDAIRLHPLVCNAFNADFDGDQMAVHLPLTEEAQWEARELMLSSKNLLKPATGEPIILPSQDIVLGCYWMSQIVPGIQGEGKIFVSPADAILAYDAGQVHLKAKIKVKITDKRVVAEDRGENSESKFIETCVGRLLFNEILPADFEFINKQLDRKVLKNVISEIYAKYGLEKTAQILDKIKILGFENATKSGLSWGINDLSVPEIKKELIDAAFKKVEKINDQYQKGFLTDQERYNRVIEVWHDTKIKLDAEVQKTLNPFGSVHSIVSSGARGSWLQPNQMSGMKGLVANPSGAIIELPIISSYKEGFDVLEYFISTHGARKGTADTALKTASAGYLTRRLVDVAQDVIISEEDCKTKNGIRIFRKDNEIIGRNFGTVCFGRVLLLDVLDPKTRKIIAKAGEIIDIDLARKIEASGVLTVAVRSSITCQGESGICQKCYGYDLGHNQLVRIGEAVGIVAAQAIGEPGTQLTMRTFHTGGIATTAGDITSGLPRVQEIFESRIPRNYAVISDVNGEVIDIIEREGQKIIQIKVMEEKTEKQKNRKNKKIENTVSKKYGEIKEFTIPPRTSLWVNVKDKVSRGDQLCEGHINLKELFTVAGISRVQKYILNEIQKIYTLQGASIHDKHIEVIIRQMFSRVKIKEPGDTKFVTGDIVEKIIFRQENRRVKANGKKPATAYQLLLGITKVALTTESFLSAASFQETARVLINAAIEGKEDKLRGLKENVIVGRLIPAGTGYMKRVKSL